MVNTRRTKFMKKNGGRSGASQPREENDVEKEPKKGASSSRGVSMVSVYITTTAFVDKTIRRNVR